ncbi:probable nucleotide pyrophosphatase homolog [plant metagenome]|uniref:Probable nucleotide pyrophosphatase homolog n=1 Tax=plant metagenome TaxID=1297885 RepID=A0A484RF23_9ZZZZ
MNPTSRYPGVLGGGLLAACLALSGCGGGDDGPDAVATPAPTPTPPISDAAGRKALVIDLDGPSYAALQDALAQGRATGLDGLQIAPAWTGGRSGTLTEQPTTGRPSWASLLTGQWSWRHGVNWEQGSATLQAPTVFSALRQAATESRSGAASTQALYVDLLRPDVNTGALNTLADCSAEAQAIDCVTRQAGDMVAQGYDLTVAQLSAPGAPAQAIATLATAVTRLRTQLDDRLATHPKESWLVLVTIGYGADRYGSATGTQAVDSKTTFIASNATLGALGTDPAAPQTPDALYARAAITDIAPTVLRHLAVPVDSSAYAFEGQALQASLALRAATAQAGADKASLALSWQIEGTPAEALRLLRDGQEIAVLPPETRSYLDDALPAAQDGRHDYRYTLVSGDAVMSWPARIDFVTPMPLATTLTNGLRSYYSFDGATPVDATGLSTLVPWDASADGGSALPADNFLGRWTSPAWRLDTTVVGADGVAGYRLRQNAGDITDNTQFTVGFWFRSNGLCARSLSNGVPIFSNKNWNSGGNPGITIGLWNGCELRFNLGGSGRIDNTGHALTDNQWAYLALVVDRSARTFTSYVFDPVKGQQIKSLAFSAALGNFVPGLGTGFSLAEDGTGSYITKENNAGSPRGQMDFNELALWNRVLTEQELVSIYRAGRPLHTLQP